MEKKRKAGYSPSAPSSWWENRFNIIGKKVKIGAVKPGSNDLVKIKAEKQVERGPIYYCEVCGSEMDYVEESAEEIVCCKEPMILA